MDCRTFWPPEFGDDLIPMYAHRFDAEASQFFPVMGPKHVVGVRVGLSYVNNETNHRVPFYDAFAPGRHTHHEFPGYGHLDVLFGRNAVRDTYPLILEELAR